MSNVMGYSLFYTIENTASLIWVEKVSYSTSLSESMSKEQELMHTRLVACWSPHMVHYAPRVNYAQAASGDSATALRMQRSHI